MTCPRCQQDNPSHAKFCLACGVLLRSTSESGPPGAPYAELQRALTEGAEQQTATAEILRIISSSPADAQPVFDAIASHALRLCDAEGVVVVRYDGRLLQVAAHRNVDPEAVARLERLGPVAPDRRNPTGRAILDGAVVHVPDLQAAEEFSESVARQFGRGSHISIPLLHQGRAVGGIGISRLRRGPFSGRQIAMLQTFADQAVIAIENVRLFTELEARNRDLSEALEQQTATSEILRVISSSPTTLDPMLEAVVKTAARLCDANNASLYRVEGDLMRKVARHGSIRTTQQVGDTRPVTRGSVIGRAMVERCTLHIADLLGEVDTEYPVARDNVRREGIRTFVATPLLRANVSIGAIAVYRTEVRPLS